MAQSVKEFLSDSYQLITPNSPTVPLHGDDENVALRLFNQMIASYSTSGLLMPIAQEIIYNLNAFVQSITVGNPLILPTPNIPIGNITNLQNAWLILTGVTYPLTIESRNTFFDSYKYDPLNGLPRFIVPYPGINVTTLRIYPAPSQQYELHLYGKFQLPPVVATGDMSGFPDYQLLFLNYALAKLLAYRKGRSEAWTDKLEDQLKSLKEDVQSVSSMNLNIESDEESYLNGSWRLRAGI